MKNEKIMFILGTMCVLIASTISFCIGRDSKKTVYVDKYAGKCIRTLEAKDMNTSIDYIAAVYEWACREPYNKLHEAIDNTIIDTKAIAAELDNLSESFKKCRQMI